MKIGGQIDLENIILSEITKAQKDKCSAVLICFSAAMMKHADQK